MSWPAPGAGAGAAGARPALYSQSQPSLHNNTQTMMNQQPYPGYQNQPSQPAVQPPAPAPAQQYWNSQQQQQYPAQYGQQPVPPAGNANHYYQYNHNYTGQGYSSQPAYQPAYPTAHYNQNAPPQQPQQGADGWEDTWNWGWDEKNAQHKHLQQNRPLPQPHQNLNANILEESFGTDDSWNWSVDGSRYPCVPAVARPAGGDPASGSAGGPTSSDSANRNTQSPARSAADEPVVRSLGDRDAVKERIPNLALGKRFHLENLTPQWSVESQMSQESSDGPPTHSEGTYKSDNQSRNSSKSSPGLNTDNTNFNYPHSALDDEEGQQGDARPDDNFRLAPSEEHTHSAHYDLANGMGSLSVSNRENLTPDYVPHENVAEIEVASRREVTNCLPTPTIPPASLDLAPPPAALPPPLGFPPPPSSGQNPFKRAGPISHKNSNKPTAGVAPTAGVQGLPPLPHRDAGLSKVSPNLPSPSVTGKTSLQPSRSPSGYPTANLETTPDNSERPDQPAPNAAAYRLAPAPQPASVENLEVAPQNDRNEYLQTAHLSSGDYGDYSGLRRTVVGQQEAEYAVGAGLSADEPPPGLSRMVPGQQTDVLQPSQDYMERRIDGQTTDRLRNQFGRGDGRRTPDDSYPRAPSSRGSEHRPFGMDRLVPGESSGEFRQQFPNVNYVTSGEQRVVTGVDRDYDATSSEMREQNLDGSDYPEPVGRNAARNVIGATDSPNVDLGMVEYGEHGRASPVQGERRRREEEMEGENLQDLTVASSVDFSFRDQRMDGAGVNTPDAPPERKPEPSDAAEPRANASQAQSLNRTNTSGEDTDRDRAFKASPRRDKRRVSDEREPRYREERKREEGRREHRDEERRHRRPPARSARYDTEDTDYYSDRERERRRYREGSYTSSKPPRPEDKERRYREEREKERGRRYATVERDRKYDERRDRDRDRDHYPTSRRDKDPRKRAVTFASKYSCEEEEAYWSPSRPHSRDPDPDLDPDEPQEAAADRRERHRDRRDRPPRHRHYDNYYHRGGYGGGGGGGYADPYRLQLQQQQETYRYYEHLRLTDPAAYMQVYKKLMAGQPLPPPPASHIQGYGYEGAAREERGSVHSGRSSANGLSKDMYEGGGPRAGEYELFAYRPPRAPPSTHTDLSGSREFNTDASLNLALEESTVRSERMTPFKYCTAHVKGSVSSGNVVVVRPSYPVDGLPATVHILSTAAALRHDPQFRELQAYPGPLINGVTHKKTVMEYCEGRVRAAGGACAGRDLPGYLLLWELLILLLRQNGMVIGTDIAELLMKNKREHEYARGAAPPPPPQPHSGSRRNSALSSGTSRSDLPEDGLPSPITAGDSQADRTPRGGEEEEELSQGSAGRRALHARSTPASHSASHSPDAERAALEKYREYLIFGNRKEALEWAMSNGLWGHALQLSSTVADRRVRAAVAARFVAAQPAADPLHTLYATMAGRQPPAASCVSDEKWGDWRPHLAMILSNTSARPDVDKRAITSLGDSLAARGLLHASQFCFVMARLEFARHPLAPLPAGARAAAAPRLALLAAAPHAPSLAHFAANSAIFTTEIYEYACSLNDTTFLLTEFQVYKWLLACRLVDCGLHERALAYVEQLARVLSLQPAAYSPHLLRNVYHMAERLKYYDPALQEEPALLEEDTEGDSAAASPAHRAAPPAAGAPPGSPAHTPAWLQQLATIVHSLQSPAEPASAEYETPVYSHDQYAYSHDHQAPPEYQQPPASEGAEPAGEAPYLQPYYNPEPVEQPTPAYPAYTDYYAQPADPHTSDHPGYWTSADRPVYAYPEPAEPPQPPEAAGEGAAGEGEDESPRPRISMPNSGGGGGARSDLFRDLDRARPHDADKAERKSESGSGEAAAAAAAAGGGGKQAGGGGWFGGIFNKLSLKPKNQMILPDDKNPTIVWDAERKRWRNLDGEEEERDSAPPPPPTALPAHHRESPPPAGAPPAAPSSNIFKMQKGRHIKKSYVDVFNPSGAASRAPPAPPPAELLPPAPPPPPPTQHYFVPTLQSGGGYESAQYGAPEPQ